jgi:hypothetical protein
LVRGKRLIPVMLAVFVLGGMDWLCGQIWHSPDAIRERNTVRQILFLGERRVIVHSPGAVATSDLQAGSWREAWLKPERLAVADRDEVWGCQGWPGIHEGPSATVWHSQDLGLSWDKKKLALPSDFDRVPSRLPGAFINEPTDPPLLLMYDLQMKQPRAGKEVDDWTSVGTRIPGEQPGFTFEWSGLRHGGTVYVGGLGQIFMSRDSGQTWSRAKPHRFTTIKIRCRDDRCFALLDDVVTERWYGIFSTPLRANDWQLFASLDLAAVAKALAKQAAGRGSIASFAATDMVIDSNNVYVSVAANIGRWDWGAVLALAADGSLRSLKGSVPGPLWTLAVSPDGSVWAGGEGAYRQTGTGWTKVWSSR